MILKLYQEVLGSIPGSAKELLSFFRDCSVEVTKSEFVLLIQSYITTQHKQRISRILSRFSYLKYFTSLSIFVWNNGKAPRLDERTNFHIQFPAKGRVYFTSKKRRNTYDRHRDRKKNNLNTKIICLFEHKEYFVGKI